MSSNYTPIGSLWKRQGYMTMPSWVKVALSAAFHEQPLRNPMARDAISLYREQLGRWDNAVSIDWQMIEYNLPFLEKCRSVPQPRLQTVMDIMVDSKHVYQQQQFGEAIYGFRYRRFAFTVYWALFFHLKNDQLARPDIAYSALWELARQISFGETSNRQLTHKMRRVIMLMLYERNRGIACDIQKREAHYITNVERRVELSDKQCKLRVQLFNLANEYFHQELLTELK